MIEHEPSQQPPLPDQELWVHIRNMNPASFEFQQELKATNELALEAGFRAVELSDIFVEETVKAPAGFRSEKLLIGGASIPKEQFTGIVHSFNEQTGTEIKTDARTLVTDTGSTIRLVDLRDQMTNNVRRNGPETDGERQKLDRAILQDLVFFDQVGHAKNSVTGVRGVNYTKLGSSKVRSYWMVVTDQQSDGAPTIARIADCRNSINAEADLYRTVFHKEL